MLRQLPAFPSAEHRCQGAKAFLKASRRGDPTYGQMLPGLQHLGDQQDTAFEEFAGALDAQ